MRRKITLLVYLLLAFSFILYGLLNIRISLPNNLLVFPDPQVTIIPSPQATGVVRVERIIDGDTIIIDGNRKLRYIGIDTPETVDPRRPAGCFGKEASEKNRELVEGKYLKLEKDVSETDKYGRLLRYVWVYDTPEATGSAIFVNKYLVEEGYAHAVTYPPDVKYVDVFKASQEEARLQNKGLWNKCNN